MLRHLIDRVFQNCPFLRDICLRWLPFASGGINRSIWIEYLDTHPSCIKEFLGSLDTTGRRYVKRLVRRKLKSRYVCSLDEALQYFAVLRTKIPYVFPANGTMLKSVFAYVAGSRFLPSVPKLKGRAVLDGGAASGDSSVALLALEPEKVYAFEPSPTQQDEIRHVLDRNGLSKRIEIVPFALSGRRQTVQFSDQHAETYTTEALSIDEFASKLDIGLIKLDIEGEEFPALKGAVKTIRRCHPYLLICVYHKPEDLFEMPNWLVGMFPEYEFVLRDTEPANKGAGVHLMMIAWPKDCKN